MQLSDRLTAAFDYARILHQDQLRKGTRIPYLSHPMAVCSLALGFGADEDEALAALLHDTAEDGGGEPVLVHIRATWGPKVEGIVRACSDSLTQDPNHKAPWRERKEAHLAHLAQADRSVRLVAAADKLHNLQSLLVDLAAHGPSVWTRFKAGPQDQLWYYRSALPVLVTDLDDPWRRPLTSALAALHLHLEPRP
jgi:GTP pyrophosphokinase